MSAPQRHFLGWNRPLIESVTEFLCAGKAGRLLDLDGTLLVTPTRQAGRRLLDALVARGVALLSQRVMTPPQLVAGALRRPGIASGTDLLGVCSRALATPDIVAADFLPNRDPVARIQVAERLQATRRELAEAALQFADVARLPDGQLEEPERWQTLARIEAACHALLASRGLTDPCAAQIAWADSPFFDDTPVRRIVMAGVPDPSLLLVRALENLPNAVRVDILIHAPATLAGDFDPFGRPLPDPWLGATLDVPDEGANLLLEADPATQAARVLAEMRRECDRFALSEIGIGVSDAEALPHLENLLARQGIGAFDPRDRPWRDHPLHGVVSGWIDLRRHPDYRAVASLLRHPFVLDAWRDALNVARLLESLDRLQNANLPLTLDDMLRPFAADPRGAGVSPRHDFADLGEALRRVAEWRETLATRPLPAALRALLREILGHRRLQPADPEDIRFTAAAETLDRVLREVEQSPFVDPDSAPALLLNRLGVQGIEPVRGDESLDLEGWLELPWNPAPFLLVTGLNEGFVPDTHLGDAFLPDSLRARLRLRDDRWRAARDAFVFRSLIEQRRVRGRAVFICGKKSAAGDPLKPSRLLFRCPDNILTRRASRLFGDTAHVAPAAPATLAFPLRPFGLPRPASPQPPLFPITRFRDYLRCPFRFYLRHELGMQTLADDAIGPNDADFGALVHAVLDAFGREPEMASCRDPERLADWLEASARGQFAQRFGPRPSLTVEAAADSAVRRLRRFAAVQAETAAEWQLEGVEQRFTMTRRGFTLVGRMDRIERHRRDGRVRVLDYKTFDRVKTPAEAHLGPVRRETPAFARVAVASENGERTRARCWIDLQLPLYRALLTDTGRFDPAMLEIGYFALPRATGETACLIWPAFAAELQNSAASCADGVLDAIASGTFWPPCDLPPEHDDFADLFMGAATPENCFTLPSDGVSAPAKRPRAGGAPA